jgi:threonine dehydratase
MIEGNGTIVMEILNDIKEDIDFILVPVGGGGLAAGIASTVSQLSPDTKVIGVEPDGAASLTAARKEGKPV